MPDTLHIATYNIHKGLSHFQRHMTVHQLRDNLRALGADIIFLQEVVGQHTAHAARFEDWPSGPQHEFLADSVWSDFAYGKNAVYDEGHHGNAILSRYPIVRWDNMDVSAHRFESRGMLHCEIGIPGWREHLHCICVHLGLFKRGQAQQLKALGRHIEDTIPPHVPLIIAGDFNDWREMANRQLARRLHLSEAFESLNGRVARSFPSALPLLRLDRIYVRGFHVEHTQVHRGHPWSRISDHAALSARMVRQ
ncbi:endonuclease/exonuclease/phosphatase family protein [Nitrosovibrio sp. Nv17]|jgi:endonuclease/exonuclease/phosphatase family metal-dependent hydrolase|uniref:endonuclease/exonuclease/phosphatase family protein n=1 Tax=Nitrosovibrio sp. Nv17 TaxID=1855339 RepID=UPI0009091488|nr:endonuclease/exonuclease/phosphatase family protein [Nitrosovibrio sp. Nv17]SFW19357.1 Metal-dependent hydrolase, endonuclease/exonuclease/phosphatase family [Nitrosovibrio sp. Nv17]